MAKSKRTRSYTRQLARIETIKDPKIHHEAKLGFFIGQLTKILNKTYTKIDRKEKAERYRTAFITKIIVFATKPNRPKSTNPNLQRVVKDLIFYKRATNLLNQEKIDEQIDWERYIQIKTKYMLRYSPGLEKFKNVKIQ